MTWEMETGISWQRQRAHGQVAPGVGIGCFSWRRGRGLWLLHSGRGRTVVLNRRGEVMYVRIVYTHAGISSSPAGDRVTAYLISRLLLYCVVSPIILWIVTWTVVPAVPVCLVSNYHYKYSDSVPYQWCDGVWRQSAKGWPEWNPFPESVTRSVERAWVDRNLRFAGGGRVGHLGRPGCYRLRARNDGAEPTQVLPGRVQNSVRVLITDDRVAPWGFHPRGYGWCDRT